MRNLINILRSIFIVPYKMYVIYDFNQSEIRNLLKCSCARIHPLLYIYLLFIHLYIYFKYSIFVVVFLNLSIRLFIDYKYFTFIIYFLFLFYSLGDEVFSLTQVWCLADNYRRCTREGIWFLAVFDHPLGFVYRWLEKLSLRQYLWGCSTHC